VKQQMGDRLQIVKINIDNYPAIATQHRIEALPTLVLFKNGQPIDRIEGVLRAEQLVERLRSSLG
jgi:thioredoxin-like negative regulator of GroEL